MKPRTARTVVISLASCFLMSVPDANAKGDRKGECKPGQTNFRGVCVSQDECCIESLCPLGEIFEFFDSPKCVPCEAASTTRSLAECAKNDEKRSLEAVDVAYKELLLKHPSQAKRLEVGRRAWAEFVDSWCGAESGYYGEGSVRHSFWSSCRQKEYVQQFERISSLMTRWPAEAKSTK
jgi:uncharacterized protein YecT (DUF1311 family)